MVCNCFCNNKIILRGKSKLFLFSLLHGTFMDFSWKQEKKVSKLEEDLSRVREPNYSPYLKKALNSEMAKKIVEESQKKRESRRENRREF